MKARKRFGQHFLEPAWVHKLVTALQARPDDRFVEIGPGRGAITRPLVQQVRHLLAIEVDRDLAAHVAPHLRRALPAYLVEDDIERIPKELRGLHPNNPVNAARNRGVQLELPPRVRGTSPLWWDWEGPHPTPHTAALIDGLVSAATTWPLAS